MCKTKSCSICIDTEKNQRFNTLKCGHHFHQSCLLSHILHELLRKTSNMSHNLALLNLFNKQHTFHCPNCRQEFSAERDNYFKIAGLKIGYKEDIDVHNNEVTYDFGNSLLKISGLSQDHQNRFTRLT